MDDEPIRSGVASWLQGRGLMVVFAAGSAVAFLFVGLLVHVFLADQIRQRELGFDEFHAEFTVQSVLANQLTVADLAGPVEDARYQELAAFTRELVLIGGVVRVEVRNRDGTVVFSDDPDLVGNQLRDLAPALERALSGRVHSQVVEAGEGADDPALAGLSGSVLETYVPLVPSGAERPQAVGKIYQDFEPNEAAAAAAVRRMDLYLGGGLLVLYILLLPLVRRTAGTLAEQADRLSDLLETERATVERLDELNEMKDLFLTAVSHELRTPLTVVRGVATTLARRREDLPREQVDELIYRLEANAGRLDGLLEDLLDLNRLLRGTMDAQRRPTDLDDLLQRVVDRLDIGDELVEVDSRVGEVELDPAQVERIVENLLDNALRHTPRDTPVWVHATAVDGGIELVVEDAGPGIPTDERRTIFEPFQHGSSPAIAHSPGTGIGLALVAQLARLHNGRVWVEERQGGGARFHVTLATTGSGSAREITERSVGAP